MYKELQMYKAYTMYTILLGYYFTLQASYLNLFLCRRFSLTVQPYAVTNKCNGLLKKNTVGKFWFKKEFSFVNV